MFKVKSGNEICILGGVIYAADRVIEDGCLLLADGKIAGVGARNEVIPPAGMPVIGVDGLSVLPGLIDLHVHGMAGADVADGNIEVVAESLARYGVTTFLSTLAPAAHEEMLESIRRLAAYAAAQPYSASAFTRPILGRVPRRKDSPALTSSTAARRTPKGSVNGGARMAGINLEGPYVSPQRVGSLNSQNLRLPDQSEAAELLDAAAGLVRIVTVAPELPGALGLVHWLDQLGVIPAVGHSDATYDEVMAAVGQGLRYATHTFNACRPFHHREPGVVGAVLTDAELIAEVISDGQHVHPAALRLLLRSKGSEHTCLVSDAMPCAGLPQGRYTWLGHEILIDGATARLRNGSLAGSIAPLSLGLRNLVAATGLPLSTVLPTCTSTPARILELETGSLRPGLAADVAVFDEDFQCVLTIVEGRIVYGANG